MGIAVSFYGGGAGRSYDWKAVTKGVLGRLYNKSVEGAGRLYELRGAGIRLYKGGTGRLY